MYGKRQRVTDVTTTTKSQQLDMRQNVDALKFCTLSQQPFLSKFVTSMQQSINLPVDKYTSQNA